MTRLLLINLFCMSLIGCSLLPVKTVHQLEKKKELKEQELTGQKASSIDRELGAYCETSLKELPAKMTKEALKKACAKVEQLSKCTSFEGKPIFHYQKQGNNSYSQKILVISLVHGDEHQSGSVARLWMERLEGISSRNTWRIIPIANPDGLKRKTRTNARGVDINRNFPSKDWEELAHKLWDKRYKKSKRRNPGVSPASEVETQCLVQQIEDYKPDFIISIHTPLAVLDFDGPKINFPKFGHLPWVKVGTFPGSLGRYMWGDNKVPVLTVELKPGNKSLNSLNDFESLQDLSGLIAILASRKLEKQK